MYIRIQISTPSSSVIMQYLELIAEDAGVPFDPKEHVQEARVSEVTTTAEKNIPIPGE